MSEFVEFEVRIDPETHMRLALLAERKGVELNDLVNEALSRALYPRQISRNKREGYYAGRWRPGTAPPYGKRKHHRTAGMFIALRDYKRNG